MSDLTRPWDKTGPTSGPRPAPAPGPAQDTSESSGQHYLSTQLETHTWFGIPKLPLNPFRRSGRSLSGWNNERDLKFPVAEEVNMQPHQAEVGFQEAQVGNK